MRVIKRAREVAQDKAESRKKYLNCDVFSVGTRVRVWDVGKGIWNQLGTIVDTVSGRDGVARSFSGLLAPASLKCGLPASLALHSCASDLLI